MYEMDRILGYFCVFLCAKFDGRCLYRLVSSFPHSYESVWIKKFSKYCHQSSQNKKIKIKEVH